MHTATAVSRPAAAAHYRDIDLAARVAAASPHQLVTMLLDGLRISLGGAARALVDRQPAQRIRTITRALAILDALEASLDFGSGGRPARSLAALYGELRALTVAGNAESRPHLLTVAAERVESLEEAWRTIAPQN